MNPNSDKSHAGSPTMHYALKAKRSRAASSMH